MGISVKLLKMATLGGEGRPTLSKPHQQLHTPTTITIFPIARIYYSTNDTASSINHESGRDAEQTKIPSVSIFGQTTPGFYWSKCGTLLPHL